MDRPTCSQFRTQLQEIKSLTVEFDLELPKVKDTRNTAPALKLEEEIRGKIRFIRESLMLARCEWAETTIGTKSKEELIKELNRNYISDNARDMIQHPDFAVINTPEKITLIRLKVKDLWFRQNPTPDELYSRAQELGLELCPPEIGPHLRLNYQEVFKREQPENEFLHIGMKPITVLNGWPEVFLLYRYEHKRWLNDGRVLSDTDCNLYYEFVFIRK
jgi:hypothetical protein